VDSDPKRAHFERYARRFPTANESWRSSPSRGGIVVHERVVGAVSYIDKQGLSVRSKL